jgi:hypothetical protein
MIGYEVSPNGVDWMPGFDKRATFLRMVVEHENENEGQPSNWTSYIYFNMFTYFLRSRWGRSASLFAGRETTPITGE